VSAATKEQQCDSLRCLRAKNHASRRRKPILVHSSVSRTESSSEVEMCFTHNKVLYVWGWGPWCKNERMILGQASSIMVWTM
jgi:hypothetical protein